MFDANNEAAMRDFGSIEVQHDLKGQQGNTSSELSQSAVPPPSLRR
jgi:hypothetical protein